jgi:hypothetical protein
MDSGTRPAAARDYQGGGADSALMAKFTTSGLRKKTRSRGQQLLRWRSMMRPAGAPTRSGPYTVPLLLGVATGRPAHTANGAGRAGQNEVVLATDRPRAS